MTTRPSFTPSAAARHSTAAAEAKAEEGRQLRSAPVTLPAAGGSPATRTSFTSPAADDRTGAAGAKAGEGPRVKQAPETRPAPYGDQAGPKASIVSGPAAPTARQVLPAGAPETTESRSDEPDGGDHT